jgi:hypothetical protein
VVGGTPLSCEHARLGKSQSAACIIDDHTAKGRGSLVLFNAHSTKRNECGWGKRGHLVWRNAANRFSNMPLANTLGDTSALVEEHYAPYVKELRERTRRIV